MKKPIYYNFQAVVYFCFVFILFLLKGIYKIVQFSYHIQIHKCIQMITYYKTQYNILKCVLYYFCLSDSIKNYKVGIKIYVDLYFQIEIKACFV